MDVLGDLVARARRSDAPALRAGDHEFDYRRFCTTTWKVGNLMRHYLGVRAGVEVAIDPAPARQAVLSFYGAALLGAPVRFTHDPGEARAYVGPTSDLPEVGPATKLLAYGETPDDPSVTYFEREVWSENPTEPTERIAPDDPLLRAVERTVSHGEALAAARAVVSEYGLASDTRVALRAPLTSPGAVVAGLVAPVLAGGTVLLPGEGQRGDFAVGDGPEPRVIDPGSAV
ncbi:hypothetical protein [Natronomonas sp. EA1]|uniref:hypothetical protein n=1 Tax=Natronomonas sp. EA1 TaxID=3421655 RepID=UPI003EBE1E1B